MVMQGDPADKPRLKAQAYSDEQMEEHKAISSWTRGSLVFYYSSDKTKPAHELALENYGTDGTWAILVKAEI